ncbi:transporter substrate-binding domain-containing protein [Nocardiopsis oceani]
MSKNANFRMFQSVVSLTTVGILLAACTSNDGEGSATGGGEGTGPAAELLPDLYQGGQITVGAISGQAPMMFVDEDDETVVGVEADVLRAAGEILGVEVVFEETDTASVIPGVLANRFDLAAGSLTYTEERGEQADFVAYAEYGHALATMAGDEDDYSFDNLCGRTVGVLAGSHQHEQFLPEMSEECVDRGEPEITGSDFPDANSLYLALESERADVLFLNEVGVLHRIEESDGEFAMADSGSGIDNKGIVINRDTDLGEPLQVAIDQLQEEGSLQEIFDDWGIEDAASEEIVLHAEHS